MMIPAEIWLYGSVARGDTDSASDVDVLVIGEPQEIELSGWSSNRSSIVRYQWAEVRAMADYGSLFLHHVRLEGRPIRESPQRHFRRILTALPPYRRARVELACFRRVVADVESALVWDYSPTFEAAVLATAARHAAILGCYLKGEPDFGRASAFRRLLPQLGYSASEVEDFVGFYSYRLVDDGKLREDAVDTPHLLPWVSRIRGLIDKVEGLA